MKSFIAAAALAGVAAAHPRKHTAPRDLEFGCGTVPSAAFIEASTAMAERERAEKSIFFNRNNDTEPIVIATYFHNVFDAETEEGGFVTVSSLTAPVKLHSASADHFD